MNTNACARFGRDPCALLIVVLAVLGTAHVLVRTASYGAAVNADTTLHLSTALNFLAGEGWYDFTGSKAIEWPPGFTLLLAAFGWVGIEPLEAGRWINAIAFGLTILAAGSWLRSQLRSQGLTLAATAILATALPLTHFAAYCITEPLFVLFALLALIQLAAFLNRKTAWSPLWAAAVFTALAALTRYVGVALIGTGVLVLLPLARLRHTLVFGAVSSGPLLAVLAYNWAVSQTLTGPRPGSGQSLLDSLSQALDVFRAWVVPSNAPAGLAPLLWLAVAAVGLSSATVVLRSLRRRSDFRLKPVLPFGGFAGGYLVFMLAVVPLTVGEGINSRFLLPVYVPLLLAAVFLLDRFLSVEAAGWMGAARYGLMALVLVATLAHVGNSAHRNLAITAEARVAGFGMYNNTYFASSDILHSIRDHRIKGRVYSNNGYLFWFYDQTAAPGKHQFLPAELHSLTSTILRQTHSGSAHIAWSRSEKSFYDFDDFDLRVLPGVEPVAELSDGVVFRVTAAEPFDAQRQRDRKQRYVQQLIQQAGEQVIRADWDVYRTGRKLTYRKKPCAPDDTQATFVLHAIPVDPADLPADRRPYGFDLLDFNFRIRGGVWLDEQCVVTAQLPDYDISRIRVGQWIAAENRTLWEAAAEPFNAERHRAQRQRYVDQLIEQADEQVIRAGWGVHRKGRKLIYRKEPCAPADVQAKLVLHVTPTDPKDLPADRQRRGYDSLGFYFDQRGFRLDDQCIAIAQLPDYPIGRIRVGQWIAKEDRTVWEAELLEIGG